MENRRITITQLAEDVGISVDSCRAIFFNVLGMKTVSAKLPNFDQKNCRMCIAHNLLNIIDDGSDLLKITAEETWVYEYEVETKAQSS